MCNPVTFANGVSIQSKERTYRHKEGRDVSRAGRFGVFDPGSEEFDDGHENRVGSLVLSMVAWDGIIYAAERQPKLFGFRLSCPNEEIRLNQSM